MDTIVRRYWKAIEERDWDALRAVVTDDVVYELPQSRERARGREELVRFAAGYPGDWHVAIERSLVDGDQAASWITFTLDGAVAPGLTFFLLDGAGLIRQITDFWPEEFEPPAERAHLSRY
ncbi:nuclear transport factor 2 family protein [Allorhizocola rhizosphaerae]|uniref:nuclear transport factor 2 family protein n=1 Tax=Allorhizocola rhizosphaerae TaxID=1872709 RepID=UPI000E3E9461|nr:nuclear transport factor 2 family protein [Allorhizocola rhizosphaerae]